MNLKPRISRQRMLALVILALAIVVLCSVTVLPVLWAHQHYEETISGMEHQLQQLQRAAAIGASLQPQYEQLKRWQATDSHYLKSSSAALGAAELQRLLNRIAAQKNVDILSTQTLATTQEQDLTRINLKVRIRGSLENIVQAFHAIEASEPFMFLDNISVRARGGRRTGKKLSVSRHLDVDLELFGYMPRDAS